jgi:predicted DNA-binding WGR domain protein
MRSTLTIGAEYLVHSGGTKYYEIVTFLNEAAKKFVEVRRWGPLATAKSGGGQTQTLEHDTAAQALESVRKQLNVKRRKDYGDKPAAWGLHRVTGNQSLGDAHNYVGVHYADAELVDELRVATGMAGTATRAEPEPTQPEKRQPEPDRGEQWGSW